MDIEKGNYRKLERVVKGFANHWRIRIMDLLKEKPELSVAEISETLKGDFKNISQHIGKMSIAGLVMKRHEGNLVRHKLSKVGEDVLRFVKLLR